jgi:uncharacterized membrane protein
MLDRPTLRATAASNRRSWGALFEFPEWRRELLRTTLWIVPAALVGVAVFAFSVTYTLDRLAFDGQIHLPAWVNNGGADAGRQVLIAIAAAVITVAGVVFSIIIVALILASQQFGPRILRMFLRDLGNQFTFGMFVATFVYSVLSLASISTESGKDFVPHISITCALGLLLVDLVVLIYFIHHVAVSIQLNEVIAGIGQDFIRAIESDTSQAKARSPSGLDVAEGRLPAISGASVPATRDGYLQAVSRERLVEIAARCDAVIELVNRPGFFVVAGHPLARVFPASAAPIVSRALEEAHVTGRHRSLSQDMIFAVDQLVEIAIRALSPAVNDTYTALACIDWLTAGLSRLSGIELMPNTYFDAESKVRIVEPALDYEEVVDRAFDKIRQSGRAMPAVAVRQLESLALLMPAATEEQRRVLFKQAAMIMRAVDEAVPEQMDRDEVRQHYRRLREVAMHSNGETKPSEVARGRLSRASTEPLNG